MNPKPFIIFALSLIRFAFVRPVPFFVPRHLGPLNPYSHILTYSLISETSLLDEYNVLCCDFCYNFSGKVFMFCCWTFFTQLKIQVVFVVSILLNIYYAFYYIFTFYLWLICSIYYVLYARISATRLSYKAFNILLHPTSLCSNLTVFF